MTRAYDKEGPTLRVRLRYADEAVVSLRAALATSQAAHLAEIEAHGVTRESLRRLAPYITHNPDDPDNAWHGPSCLPCLAVRNARRVLAAEGKR